MENSGRKGLAGALSRLRDEGLLTMVVVPVVMFSLADIISTYVGVCGLGGFELNRSATAIIYALGFVPSVFLQLAFYSGLSLLWAGRISGSSGDARTFFIALFAIYFAYHTFVVVGNLSTITGILTGTPPVVSHGPVPEAVLESFDRAMFCRWFP